MLTTLIELQRLKRLERTGWTLRGLPNGTESVAAHSFGVCATAMLLADKVKAEGLMVDCERVLRLALLHDWAETRVGDMPRTGATYFMPEARRNAETQAFADVVKELGAAATDYQALFDEYEKRRTLESRLVKAADIIDLLVQAYAMQRAGAKGLDEFWEIADAPRFQLPPIAERVVNELLQTLLTARRELN
jgi:putative hydrolase of HD superfamily